MRMNLTENPIAVPRTAALKSSNPARRPGVGVCAGLQTISRPDADLGQLQ